MNKEFFINKREELVNLIEDGSLVVFFSGCAPQKSADEKYDFVVNKNFYYLTGIERENFILLLGKRDGKYEETLFIEKVSLKEEKWTGKRLTEEESKEISGIENIYSLQEFKNMFNNLLKNDYEYIYLDLEKTSWESVDTPALSFAKDINNKYPYLKIKNIYGLVSRLRMIKSEEEVKEIRKAIKITNDGIKSLMKNSKVGMKEYQLEAYFDFTIKVLGAKRHSFKTIAASGANATILHYDKNDSEINSNNLILFDLGSQYNNYCADISRTFPINGRFTERQKQIYNIVLKAQQETIEAIRPGVKYAKLNEITKKVLIEECKKINLINKDNEISKYYYHGVSHYLGLDTHDVGIYGPEVELEEGMVITIEPGLYIEEESIGIRIEDNILVTEDGYENLSQNIIKTVEDIEKFMNN
ncbi:Xaa-Pro aminopeptidase [Gottschalkia purinilytica]|uniref:Xaa-Pro aminopeptidase n=1 Tax=Gottschalkia purinilytica TaxID=1503 RepID=A0A0L0WD21_GOTPU|nr:aminopeptidase P family protein [Gottschalkia purinilytica]KNF09379.1 Xaa-Pro aminopeptidase [Gottschalkia purinilytica]